MDPITSQDLYRLIVRLLNYRQPTVCRHAIACDVLQLLETTGHPLNKDLVKAVVEADDETAIALIEAERLTCQT